MMMVISVVNYTLLSVTMFRVLNSKKTINKRNGHQFSMADNVPYVEYHFSVVWDREDEEEFIYTKVELR